MSIRCRFLVTFSLVAMGLLAIPASAQTQLRWKLAPGEALNHTLTQDSDTSINVAGQMITTKMSMVIKTLWNVKQVDAKGVADITQSFAGIKFKLNSTAFNFEYDSAAPMEPTDPIAQQIARAVKPLTQAKFNFKLTPLGQVTDVVIPEESQKLLDQVPSGPQMAGPLTKDGIVAMIKDSVVPFPAEAVQAEDSWKHTSELKAPPIGTMTNDSTLTYAGPVEVEGKALEQINFTTATKIASDANNKIAQVSMKDQSETGTIFFNNQTGRLSHSKATQKMVMDVAAAGQKFEQNVTTVKTAELKSATPGR